jgi:hypothetical protein
MTDRDNALDPNQGRFGGYINRYEEYEINFWIWEQIQKARGLELNNPPTRPDKQVLIPLREVMRRTGLGRMTIYRLEKQGKFPQRIPLTADAIAA